MERIIASKEIYNPIAYIQGMTGNCYFGSAVRNNYIVFDIECLLRQNNVNAKHFPMNSIERAIKAKKPVVLVDCSHYVGNRYVEEHRWFQVCVNFFKNLED